MKEILVISSDIKMPAKIADWVQRKLLPKKPYVFLIETVGRKIHNECNTYFMQDFSDRAAVKKQISLIFQNHKISEVISSDEFSVYLASEFCQLSRIQGYSLDLAQSFRDKLHMKRKLSDAGIRVPLVYRRENLLSGDYTLPLILKPRSLAGSVGVEVLRNSTQVKAVLANKSLSLDDVPYIDMSTTQYEVEEFVDGRVFHLDGLYSRKEGIKFLVSSEYILGNCLDYIQGRPMGTRMLIPSESEAFEWEPFTEKILITLGAPDGAFHLEAFLTHTNEKIFLEIGLRPGGGLIPCCTSELFKVDLLLNHIRLQIGLPPLLAGKANSIDDITGDIIFPKIHDSKKPVKIKLWERNEREWKSEIILCHEPSPGDIASGTFFSHQDYLAAFLFRGHRDSVIEDMTWLINNVRIETEEINESTH